MHVPVYTCVANADDEEQYQQAKRRDTSPSYWGKREREKKMDGVEEGGCMKDGSNYYNKQINMKVAQLLRLD